MPNDKLREFIERLEKDWFFKCILENVWWDGIEPIDLTLLPQKYRKRLEAFISSHSAEEVLRDLKIMDFIEQATGEPIEKALKLITIAKKKQSLEQDFK